MRIVVKAILSTTGLLRPDIPFKGPKAKVVLAVNRLRLAELKFLAPWEETELCY